jgi:hypothetical protein
MSDDAHVRREVAGAAQAARQHACRLAELAGVFDRLADGFEDALSVYDRLGTAAGDDLADKADGLTGGLRRAMMDLRFLTTPRG